MAVPGHFKRVYFSYFIQTLLLNWLYLDLNCASLDSEITAIVLFHSKCLLKHFFIFSGWLRGRQSQIASSAGLHEQLGQSAGANRPRSVGITVCVRAHLSHP